MIARGFVDNTLLTRGFGGSVILEKILGIFLTSKLFPVINLISRVAL